jgi:uncharacterized protein
MLTAIRDSLPHRCGDNKMTPYSLKISDDKYRAFLTIEPPFTDNVTVDSILGHLHNAGVVFGIDEAAIRDLIERKSPGEKKIVAAGKSPVKGKDGAVEYLFSTQQKLQPKINADGSADYRNLNLTQNVIAGQELARLIPPPAGENGRNVLGNIIPAPKGKPARISKGKNTSFADTEKNILKSDIDGNVKLDHGGAIEVDAVFKVPNSVDFNTGNIDIKGDLTVNGDIKAGFKVKASGEIEVGGTIEDAEIDAGGSVLVKGGFLGDGKGIIRSGNDIILKFIHGQKVVALHDIHVHEESIQGDLSAGESILANEGKGIIIGGKANAGKNAIIKVIGNVQYTKTEIVVAEKAGLKERVAQLNKEINGLNAKIDEITKQMTSIMTKGAKSKLSPSEENEFRILDKLSADITATEQALRSELTGFEEKLKELRLVAFIKVLKRVYPGTVLRIAGLTLEINEEFGPGEFRVVNNQISHIQ